MNHSEQFSDEYRRFITRRWFFKECGVGLGAIALGSLLRETLGAATPGKPALTNPLAPRQPHFAAKAKRVIYLFMAGAPSHRRPNCSKATAPRSSTLPPNCSGRSSNSPSMGNAARNCPNSFRSWPPS
jgi:hypothetical protein